MVYLLRKARGLNRVQCEEDKSIFHLGAYLLHLTFIGFTLESNLHDKFPGHTAPEGDVGVI